MQPIILTAGSMVNKILPVSVYVQDLDLKFGVDFKYSL